jgi:N-acetyl-gamma-glutamyl-phosphate reductase
VYRAQIKQAALIANPGCYPTSVILALTPLLKAGMIRPASIIVDAKSGTTGAGRAAQVGTLFCEVSDGFRPYKVGSHRHTPEIEQEINCHTTKSVIISFTQHLLPINRGIESTIYAEISPEATTTAITDLYHQQYEKEPFVRILPEDTFPATQFVRGSNFCDIGFKLDMRTNRIIIMSVIDNIVKGAAGQAVQNMNLLYDFPETTGLENLPFFP